MVKHWNRLSGQVVESLSLEILKTKLDVVLKKPAPVTLLWALQTGWSPEVLFKLSCSLTLWKLVYIYITLRNMLNTVSYCCLLQHQWWVDFKCLFRSFSEGSCTYAKSMNLRNILASQWTSTHSYCLLAGSLVQSSSNFTCPNCTIFLKAFTFLLGATASESAVRDTFSGEIRINACKKLNGIKETGRFQYTKICFHD